ncbi:LLM class F420-dependent oxidoreductase [Actinomycetospora sp. NBRC 106375]|uniref:LLM class F420-dependent oxidoreductase n=1 Tax=Actinomycetospora sp. NBRC 106375 TaxID=3032207 RepID=UPI0024A27FAF|nr:LLM class F420-dependent oxidoreductase [Actinomycetospora sp. NBRC 106375]GLZ47441.1 LLM class F420-dependent oxidoreductase [Actinomycetospora sp. NBRC 106375]
MDLRIFTEPQQGAAYDDLLRVARASEDAGFDAFFRSDHYLAMGDANGLPGPTDAWVTLAGLARETSTIRLGTLMTAATFRLPGPLGVMVAQVDQMSGGRVELGLGTGWYEAEHRAYGIPFPPLAQRFSMLAEQLEILTGSWRTPVGVTYSHEGEHYRFSESPGLPKPIQTPHPPIVVGGNGPRRTPALAAAYGTEFNMPFAGVDDLAAGRERADDACRALGRDPATLGRSTAQVVCAGRDEAEVARRADAIGRDPGELRKSGLAGTPAEIVDKIGTFAARAGLQRIYLQVLDLSDLDHLDLVASEIARQV